jgi:hypothetical protein
MLVQLIYREFRTSTATIVKFQPQKLALAHRKIAELRTPRLG